MDTHFLCSFFKFHHQSIYLCIFQELRKYHSLEINDCGTGVHQIKLATKYRIQCTSHNSGLFGSSYLEGRVLDYYQVSKSWCNSAGLCAYCYLEFCLWNRYTYTIVTVKPHSSSMTSFQSLQLRCSVTQDYPILPTPEPLKRSEYGKGSTQVVTLAQVIMQ